MTSSTERTGLFGRLQTYPTSAQASVPAVSRTTDIAELPGFGGLVQLTSTQGWTVVLTLWRSRESAELLEERLASPIPEAVEDEVYELDDTIGGKAEGLPTVAFLGRFAGPLSAAQLTAARRRGSTTFAPLLGQVPGLVRVVILWHPLQRGMVVVHLAEDRDALHRVSEVVNRTPLGPAEDPTLFPGPDRVELNQVDHYAWCLNDTALHHA